MNLQPLDQIYQSCDWLSYKAKQEQVVRISVVIRIKWSHFSPITLSDRIFGDHLEKNKLDYEAIGLKNFVTVKIIYKTE